MGIKDVVATVLTKYKADTTQMRKELKKLSGEEKKRHEAAISQAEKQNTAMDTQVAMLGKLAVAAGAALAAYKVLDAGLDTLQKNSSLRAATAGVDLEGLRKATNGLVDDTRLLEFAAASMNGTFKLSQKEMEGALQGTLALRKSGKDLSRTLDRVQQSVTEGTTEPLKELGLVIKGAENDTQEGLTAALGGLSAEAEKMGGNFDVAGDEIRQAQTEIDNALDSMSESMGELAAALGPVISFFAEMTKEVAGTVREIVNLISAADSVERKASKVYGLWLKTPAGRLAKAAGILDGPLPDSKQLNLPSDFEAGVARSEEFERNRGNFQQLMGNIGGGISGAAGSVFGVGGNFRGGTKKSKAGRYTATSADPSQRSNNILGYSSEQLGGFGNADFAANTNSSMRTLADLRGTDFGADETLARLQETILAQEELYKQAQEMARNGNILSQIFGAPAEIDATAEALTALSSGFDGLTGAFGAGVDALITGSDSFANAFKNAIGESLRSMAVEMSIRALRETAMGAAALIWNPGVAAGHFYAAAAFTAGAGAAGYAANKMGAGATPATPSVSPGAGLAGVGSANPGGGPANSNTNVVFFDDDFASMGPREREARFRTRARSAGFSVSGDVVVNG